MLQPEALPNDLERASIRTTWTTSANILKQRMAGEDELGPQHCAYKLLHLFVYFNSLDLDYELLQNTKLVNNPPAWILKVFESKLDFYSTVKILLDLSIIDKTNTNGVYSMHRVVFDWLSIYEAHETQEELLNVAAAAIAWACPITYVPVFWAESQQRLILHANVLHQRLRGRGSLVRPVWYDPMRKADLKLAAVLWECDVDSLRHGRVYQPIGDIARLISTGGKPEEALDLIEDAITHTISSSPERDLSYYVLLYEKASMLADSELSEEAYTILLEAVDGFQRLQAPYWLVCAHILEGCQKPDVESAIQAFETALVIGKYAGFCIFYDPTWLAFDNIDRNLQWQLRDQQRRRVHLESVKGQALTRGYDLPNARVALRNLAFLYVELGLRPEAEPLYLKLLEWQVRRYGRDASEVISSVQELAWFYFNQASVKSIKYDSEWLRLAELHHGPTSREAEMAHLFLAESYEKHGQTVTARRHFAKAWEISQDTKAAPTQKLILSGLVRASALLGDEENVIKYQALQRGVVNNTSEHH